jgi:argininosuccinate lyase
MDGVCQNSLDAVSDRDFAIEFAAAAALCMVHVSRFSEELVLWMSQNFGFIDLADRFCTGSSIMPQKKNPDVPELARGKTGRVVGHLMALLTLMKGQPLAYNKDNQEDKEPLFDSVDTLKDTLRIFASWSAASSSSRRRWSRRAARGYATATDLADYLVKKGLPFRDAHELVARAVRQAIEQGVDLAALPLETLQSFHPAIEADVHAVLSLRGSLDARGVIGGTAPRQVRAQVARHRARPRLSQSCLRWEFKKHCLASDALLRSSLPQSAPQPRQASAQRNLLRFVRARLSAVAPTASPPA